MKLMIEKKSQKLFAIFLNVKTNGLINVINFQFYQSSIIISLCLLILLTLLHL